MNQVYVFSRFLVYANFDLTFWLSNLSTVYLVYNQRDVVKDNLTNVEN